MPNNNDKQERAKQKVQTDPDVSKKQKVNEDTDTAPDEFIGADADTDTPIDGTVINDAVLRGENHPDEGSFNSPDQDNNEENDPGTAKKMDADKK